jgi:hypothetical protein
LDWTHALEYACVAVASVGVTLLVFNLRAKRGKSTSSGEIDRSVITPPNEPSLAVLQRLAPAPLATELTFGIAPEAAAVTLLPLTDVARFRTARSIVQPEPVLGRLNAMMQAIPGVLVADQHAGKHLMEVVINGDLIRAADGVGFRAMAKSANGISEHARLLESANLTTLVNAAAIWQVASVLVAQKHLADISARLQSIEAGIDRLSTFLDNERRSRLTGTYKYLKQLFSALNEGRLPMQAAGELEPAERDLLSIFDHLEAEFLQEARRQAKDGDTFGTEDVTNKAFTKIKRLEDLASDLRLCLQVRTAAWYILAVLPDVHGLQRARRLAIEEATERLTELAGAVTSTASTDAARIQAFWNREETLRVRRQQVRSSAKQLRRSMQREVTATSAELQVMFRALEDSSRPMKLLLAVEHGKIVETRVQDRSVAPPDS